MSKMRNVPLKKYVIPLFTFHQLFLKIYFKKCGVFIPYIEIKLKKKTTYQIKCFYASKFKSGFKKLLKERLKHI